MFDQCLYFNTTALARLLEREWSSAFKPFGLTPSQAFMLRAILAKGSLAPSELATELHLSRPTVSRILDGVEKMGLVKRMPGKEDGREMEVRPTAKAIALADRLNAASGEVTRKLKSVIGNGAFNEAVAALRGIASVIR